MAEWQNRQKFSSLDSSLVLTEDKNTNQIMGLTSRREKIVLFGDSLTLRAIEQGGWGESLVRREFIFISFFFSFIITRYMFSFFACLC